MIPPKKTVVNKTNPKVVDLIKELLKKFFYKNYYIKIKKK
jgi:hypothetical protein